ncbi:MAG TPA: EAL domain-containing protein [Acidobacteriaceae bacterium]|nr:EAL domain-containing protein [Acidobacteriaceae bacterium]
MLVNTREVRHAIESDAIVPCFQPLVDLRSMRLTGFEVLTRWRHPSLGLILPSNFIQLAEELGIIGILTREILRKAFRSAATIPGHFTLAVNVSPIQLRYRSLPTQIGEAAENAGLPLDRLVMEITETAILENENQALAIAEEIKTMGCQLAIDDFGTGYASLRHLMALPFDQIKVDRSFVQQMTVRPASRKIVAAVVGLGHSLGLTTLAEGVEMKEQESLLLQMGCSLAQGWLYGRPLTADQIPLLLGATPHTATRHPLARLLGTSA